MLNEPHESVNEACTRMGVSRRTMYNWLKAGKLRTARDAGGALRIAIASLWLPDSVREVGQAPVPPARVQRQPAAPCAPPPPPRHVCTGCGACVDERACGCPASVALTVAP
jgi:excisionase family DNA binding protein